MNDSGEWSRALHGELYERWPKDENGEPEEPVRLGTLINLNMFDELTCLRVYPGDGSFGRIIFGMSGQGTDIYVPKSMADDAAALCNYDGDYEPES